ncbi:MAG: hypothetical protein SFU86_17905 [Pirellulaceae bacterium]|nr:hypothetical protein [Pirellulaceae bacterium]
MRISFSDARPRDARVRRKRLDATNVPEPPILRVSGILPHNLPILARHFVAERPNCHNGKSGSGQDARKALLALGLRHFVGPGMAAAIESVFGAGSLLTGQIAERQKPSPTVEQHSEGRSAIKMTLGVATALSLSAMAWKN